MTPSAPAVEAERAAAAGGTAGGGEVRLREDRRAWHGAAHSVQLKSSGGATPAAATWRGRRAAPSQASTTRGRARRMA